MKQVILHFNDETEARFVARELSKLAEQANHAADKSNDNDETITLSEEAKLLEEASIQIRQSYGDLFLIDSPKNNTEEESWQSQINPEPIL
jgi:hypothetical protein